MKRLPIMMILVLVNGLAHCQPELKSATISGSIKGVAGKNIYFLPAMKLDSIFIGFIKDEYFTISRPFVDTKLLEVRVQGSAKSFFIVLEQEEVRIEADISNLENANVTGSVENRVYQEYENQRRKIGKRKKAILDSLSAVNYDSTKSVEFAKEFEIGGYRQFIRTYPSSFASLNHCYSYTTGNPVLAGEYLSMIDKSLKEHPLYKEIELRTAVEMSILIKRIAPDFTQETSLGETFTLSCLKGKYVLIDFWASWCGPCRQESPNLVKAYSTYSSKGFEIVSISLDSEKEKWLAAIAKDNYSWINTSDLQGWKNKVARLYNVRAVPTNYLLDKEGKIIGTNLTGEKLNQKLLEIFSK